MKRTARFACLLLLVLPCSLNAQEKDSPAILEAIRHSKPVVVLKDGTTNSSLKINRQWSNATCQLSITNTTSSAQSIKEVILFTAARLFPATTPIYAEGFQMLSQTTGTLGDPQDLGQYTDRNHYKIPEPPGYRAVYNLLFLSPATDAHYLMGFSSSRRFVGKFYLSTDSIKVVMDLENLPIAAGATWKLEDFFLATSSSRNDLFTHFSLAIEKNHPRLQSPLPTGWCSWYCFGPRVTAKDIYDNLGAIKKEVPALKYIQLDDGYQSSMGDWMAVGPSFGGGIKDVLLSIKKQGFEPAIWVAPFICDSNSTIFKEHKDWLVKNENGAPLRSDKVGFGGWRLAPWYVLDGTNPAVQQHLVKLFAAMRSQWGCTYFKLDANYWGAIHGGVYFKKGATRTEAYRSGMKAILQGAGKGAFILGCNHPLWPSLGLIHGSRSSMDISASWDEMRSTGRENLYRSWQNGHLWWNDPDCLLLTGNLPDNIFMFHTALLYSTGGMLLSGDNIPALQEKRLAILKKMAHATGQTAAFDSDEFNYGWINNGKEKNLVVLNWNDQPRDFHIPVQKPCTVTDFFSGEKLGDFKTEITLDHFAAQNGAVYIVQEK